MTLMRRLMM